MTAPGRILVVGGGFSGLSSAIMLARGGWSVDLIERHPGSPMDGAGISIGSATLRALDTLGVLDRFLADGWGCDGTDVRSPRGDLLATFSTPRLVAPGRPGNGAILRPLLGSILADAAAAAGVRVHLGTVVDERRDRPERVNVTLSNGTRGEYDLLVGADGIHSSLRPELFPEAPAPRFSGQGAWRAVVPRPAEVTRTTMWVGAGTKVGVNPISEREMYLFVNENTSSRERIADDELLPRLRALLAPFPDPLLREARASLGPRRSSCTGRWTTCCCPDRGTGAGPC